MDLAKDKKRSRKYQQIYSMSLLVVIFETVSIAKAVKLNEIEHWSGNALLWATGSNAKQVIG